MAFDNPATTVIITAKDQTAAAWDSLRAEANKSAADMQAFGDKVLAPFKAVQGAIAGIGAAFASFELLSFTNKIAESAAALDKMSQVTGASVESLSALSAVAKLSNTDMGTVEAAIIKMDAAMSGVGKNAKTFGAALDYLGTSAVNSNGDLKSTDDVLLEIALGFEQYADGAGKTALAQAAFGKAGAQMIPVLHDLAVAGQYNAKITTDQAAASRQYEEDLKRLAALKASMAKQIVLELVPALDDLVKTFLVASQQSAGLRGEISKLSADHTIRGWAEEGAQWIAHFIDTFRSIPREVAVALTQVKISFDDFYLHAAKLASAGGNLGLVPFASNPWTQALQQNLTADQAYLAQLKKDGDQAQGLYQRILAQQIALSHISDSNSDQNDRRFGLNTTPVQPQAQFQMPDAAKGVDLIAQALKYYGDVLGQISGQEKAYTEGMEKLLLLYNARLITVQQLAVAEKFLYDTKTLAGQEISKLSLENQKIQDQIDLMTRVGVALTGSNEAAASYAVTYGKLKDLYPAEKDAITDLARKLDLRIKEEQALKDVAAAHLKIVEAMIKEFDQERLVGEQITTNNNAEYARAFAVNQALENEIKQIGLTTVEREKANAQILREAELTDAARETDATTRAAMINSINILYDARNKLFDLKDAKTQLLEMSNSLTDALLSAWENGKSGTRAFLDWLKGEFAKTILRPQLQTVVNSLFGGVGLTGSTGASAATGGNAFGGIVSAIGNMFGSSGSGSGFGMNDRSLGDNSLSGLFDKYLGLNSAAVKGIGDIAIGTGIGIAVGRTVSSLVGDGGDTHHDGANIGAIAGAIIGSYYGGVAGAQIGGALGGAAGGIFDSFNPGDAMRTAKIGTGPGDYTYASTGGPFGDLGIQRFSDQHFSDADMSQTLNTWFDTIGKLDKEVAHHFSGDEIQKAITALAGQSTEYQFGIEHTSLDPEVLSSIVKQRFSTIFGVIDQQMADLVANFKGSGTDLVTLVVDLATVHERLTGLHAQMTSLFGQEVGFADITALKGDTEGYTAALQRLADEYTTTNRIAEMLGKTQAEVWGSVGLASEGARAHLIELAGGLQNLSSQLDFYYTHFYTTAEQQKHTLTTLQQAFSDVGVAMPMTVDGFRAITDQFLGMGEAGAQAAASMLALAPTFYDYIGAIESVDTALKKNQLGFRAIFGQPTDISVTDVQGFQQNGEVLTATLTRLTDEFNSTNNLLVMFGLSSQQVFGAFGLASEAARAHLIDLAGGLQTFTSELTSFYQNYFSQSERNQLSLQQMQGVFSDLGLQMPTTTQGFKDLVLHELALGPAGASAVAALLGIQQQFFDLYNVATATAPALGAVSGGISHLKPPVVDDLGKAAAIAHDNLVKLNDTLKSSFQDAYRSIQMAGLDNQQQYAYLQKESADYVKNLNSAGTGADVQTWAEKIKADMLAAFNLLSPDEQSAHKQEFLDNLLTISQMASDRLAALDPLGTLNKPIVEPAAAAATAQVNAAQTQQDAAGVMKKSADIMYEAATGFLVGTKAGQRVRIELPGLGTTEAGA